MKYSRVQLTKAFNQGQEMDFLFFWGHQSSKDGSVSKSCFSQWWMASFTEHEIQYKSAEHYMMAMKAELFDDIDMNEMILNSETPGKAKALGRKVRNFDADVWDANKYDIVKTANRLKFSQNPELHEFIIQTGNKILVEASPVDQIWGIGLAKDNTDATNPNLWQGENLLGFALMEVRDELTER
ncbi:MAG: NADAR family protein [Bacteroidota bacterium]